MKNIILIGFMGVGKSSVAKSLAPKIKYSLVDINEMIEQAVGVSLCNLRQQITDEEFLQLEQSAINDVYLHQNQIIVLGYTALINENLLRTMKNNGYVIGLKASLSKLIKNIVKDEKENKYKRMFIGGYE